ncbi:MAG: hypothetical protein HRU20_26605 [Pseudomonadales bacterium]|nr:hypothetical protein [Pseudomonadales bacterium]
MVANTAAGDGGALQRSAGSLTLQRSLVLANTVSGNGNNINNSFTDADYNIVGFNNVSGMTGGAVLSAGNSFTATDAPVADDASRVALTLDEIVNTAPRVALTLDEIVNTAPSFKHGDGYFGKLKTMPLLAESIARDAIPLADCGVINEDQRGELRPDSKNNACDIGAYEYTVLTCSEDAQRRYEQGEIFVKACTEKLSNFELGAINNSLVFLLMLVSMLAVQLRRRM